MGQGWASNTFGVVLSRAFMNHHHVTDPSQRVLREGFSGPMAIVPQKHVGSQF